MVAGQTTEHGRCASQAVLPPALKSSITVAIGVFQAFVGFQLMGLVVKSESTMVGLGDLGNPALWLSMTAAILCGLRGCRRDLLCWRSVTLRFSSTLPERRPCKLWGCRFSPQSGATKSAEIARTVGRSCAHSRRNGTDSVRVRPTFARSEPSHVHNPVAQRSRNNFYSVL